MSTNKVKDPIKVFISSKCDGKYRAYLLSIVR